MGSKLCNHCLLALACGTRGLLLLHLTFLRRHRLVPEACHLVLYLCVVSYVLLPIASFVHLVSGQTSFRWRPLFFTVTQRDVCGRRHYDLCYMRNKLLAHSVCCVWTRKRALMLFMEFFLPLMLITGLRCSILVGETGYRLEDRDLILCNRNKSTLRSSCSPICKKSITLVELSPRLRLVLFLWSVPVKLKTSTEHCWSFPGTGRRT